jgi:DNA-binding transcriptional LysR family regulator
MKHNLLTLKLFLTVAKAKSIAQASEAENVAASAISKRISDLEHHIGTPLFYRQTKGVELTPAGREMMVHAYNIMRLVERMDAHMGDYASGLRGTVRIAANTSAITQFLPEDLAGFVEEHPDMRIELTEQTSEDILDAVRDGLADVGIFSGQISASDLDELTYRRDTLVVVMAKNHPFVSEASVTLAEISRYDMVGLHRGSSLQAFLENCSAEQGLNLKTRVDVLSFDGVRRMVEAGLGIAVLPLGAVEPYLETSNLRMLAIAEPWAQRTLKLALRDLETTTRPIRMLVQHLTAQALPSLNE